MKMDVTLEDMKVLALRSTSNGTEHAWMDVALQWMEAANKRISELEQERNMYDNRRPLC